MVLTLSLSLNVCDNCDSAEFLYLFSNQLSGPIPSAIGLLANLTELLLDGNQLSGTIPSELGGLSQLRKYGHLGDSLHFIILILLFCGIDTFSNVNVVCDNCDSAERLSLPNNGLTGSIPDSVCALTPNPLLVLSADCSVCTAGTNCCSICFN